MEATFIRLELPKPKTETVRVLVKQHLGRDISAETAQRDYEDLVTFLHGGMASLDSLTREAEEQSPAADQESNDYQTGQKQVIDLIRRRHSKLSDDFIRLTTGR